MSKIPPSARDVRGVLIEVLSLISDEDLAYWEKAVGQISTKWFRFGGGARWTVEISCNPLDRALVDKAVATVRDRFPHVRR